MRLRIIQAAAMVFLLGGEPAAQPAEPTQAFLKRADELVRWIAANSEYSAALRQEPKFVFLSPAAIRHSFSRSSMGYSSDTSAVRAAQTRGTIFLPDTFLLGRDDYILVHELVHHLQDESGRSFACLAEREREAYRLQTRFVQETGVGETPNDMFMLLLRCDIR